MLEEAHTLINTVAEIGNTLKRIGDGASVRSLSSQALLSRIEPRGVVEEQALTFDGLSDILQASVNLVSIYFIQAAMNGSQVGDVKVKKVLEQLNPNRGVDTWLMAHENRKPALAALTHHDLPENYRFALPTCDSLRPTGTYANESGKVYKFDAKKMSYELTDDPADRGDVRSVTTNDKLSKILYEPSNLLVGKVFDLEFKHKGDSINIPIVVRLRSDTLPSSVITQIMVQHGQNIGMFSRLEAAWEGEIEWIDDFLFAKDLRKARKAARLADKTGIYDEIVDQVRNNRTMGVLTLTPSYNTASSIWVVTKPTMDEVALKLGGTMKDLGVRKKLFDNIFAFIVAVIDTDYERVTFYYHDIPYPTSVSMRDIKAANKAKGPDVTDVLKTYTMGNAPTF